MNGNGNKLTRDRGSAAHGLLGALAALFFGAAVIASDVGTGRAADASAPSVLAPMGRLRVGLYPGTPTSILQADQQSPEPRGVGYNLGKAIAARLGVPYEPVVFAKNAEVLEAVKTGQVDMAFTNATASRAKDMDFGPPYLEIEMGYLVPTNSRVRAQEEVDATGHRVGVTTASTSDSVLSRDLKSATLVRTATISLAVAALKSGELDAFATNKATLFEMAEKLPGSHVLDGRWGVERHAIAIPKGREQGLTFIEDFTRNAASSGLIASAITRAGLRGAIVANPE